MLYNFAEFCWKWDNKWRPGVRGGGRERKMIMGERGEGGILGWESGTFRFPFHLVSERFNCSKWLTPAHQRDRDGGRVTERMTLMDTRRGERGKESDRDRVKDIVREFNGEKEGSVLSFFLVGASVSAHWNATETALFLCGLTLLPGLDLRAPGRPVHSRVSAEQQPSPLVLCSAQTLIPNVCKVVWSEQKQQIKELRARIHG